MIHSVHTSFAHLVGSLAVVFTFACCGTSQESADYDGLLTLADDSLFQSYVADTAFFCLEQDTNLLYNCPYIRPLELPEALQGNGMLDSLTSLYNFMAVFNAINTDIDAIWRFEDQELAAQACFDKVDLSLPMPDTVRNMAKRLATVANTYAQNPALFSETDTLAAMAADDLFSEQLKSCIGDIESFVLSGDRINLALVNEDFEKVFSPARWVPDCFTVYVGENADPSSDSLAILMNAMRAETCLEVKSAQLFTLAGANIDADAIKEVLGEMERLMESGVYVPTLHLLWRAYRAAYNIKNVGISGWCYSPNLRYNHYRCLVALTYMNYLAAHPDDEMAYMALYNLIIRTDILRHGYLFGNSAPVEHINLYWHPMFD